MSEAALNSTPDSHAVAARRPADYAARVQALDPSDSFLIQAPAGSGKTELLTDRILSLLATVDRPEEIVAITFTRKATSEMHARVFAKLRAALDPAPDSEHGRRSWALAREVLARDQIQGWELLKHPARLSIQTFDSFSARLVRAMPWMSELGGMPSIAEDSQRYYTDAAQATLDLADDFPDVRVLLEHMDVNVGQAVEAIAAMLGQRDRWLPLLAHSNDQETAREALADAVAQDLQGLIRSLPLGINETLSQVVAPAVAALDAADGRTNHPLAALRDWAGRMPAERIDALAQWRALAHLLLTGTGSLRSPKGINKNLGFPAGAKHKAPFVDWLASQDPSARWVSRLARVRELPSADALDERWALLSAQLMVLRLAVAQLRIAFQRSGEVDFVEIAQRALAALGSADDPGELLLKLDASIRHLLVDEFQDTSHVQMRLIEMLTSGWQPNDGRTLFLVGDPMQSIYRFRHAEVGLFLQVREQGIGEIMPQFLALTDNFRSQAGIVTWVNQAFGALFPREDDARAGAIAYAPAAAFNPALDGDAVGYHFFRESADPGDAGSQLERQARARTVALAQAALHEGGVPRTVAVLVRARGNLRGLVQALARAGVACRAVELDVLAQRPVVADLVQLVRALAHPADRMAWLSLLRAPCCGLTLRSLHHLFGDTRSAEPVPMVLDRLLAGEPSAAAQALLAGLDAQEADRLRHVASVLRDRSNESGALPLGAWVRACWQRLGGARLYPGGSAQADAESLFRLLESRFPYGDVDSAQLDRALQRLFGAPEAVREGPVVEIMTMHKSKGLQFDTVILYGLHHRLQSNRAPLVSFEQEGDQVLLGPVKRYADEAADPISYYLAQREKRRNDYEIDRLLYVAATRAKHRLHLVGGLKADTGEPERSSLLGRLWPCLPPQAQPDGEGASADVRDSGLANASLSLQRLDWVDVQSLARMAPPPVISLPARLDFSALVETESALEARAGTLAHAWLARIGQDGLAKWDAANLQAARPRMTRQLLRAGSTPAQADTGAQIVLETLSAALSQARGRWLLSLGTARREWALADAQGHVSVIDLAVQTAQGWLVVDFKTGVPRAGEGLAHFGRRMAEVYGDQMARYRREVRALDGRTVACVLYFPRAGLWLELDDDTLPSETDSVT